ncbi:thioredoxin [Streptococcus pantholopis]
MTKQLTTETFASEIKSGVTLVDFGASWCPPCRMLEPIVDELSEDFEGQASIAKVDVDESQEVAAKFGIRSIPTMILFKDGQVVDTAVGVQSKQLLADKISNQL